MALSANKRRVTLHEGRREYIGAAASAVWYEGSLIVRDASGFGRVVAATDDASVEVLGVACRGGDNTGGSAGDVQIEVEVGQIEELALSGLTAAHVGRDVMASADDTVVLASAPGEIWVPQAQDSAAGSTTSETVLGAVPSIGPVRVYDASFVPIAAVTADASNYATVTLSKYTAAGGSKTTVASLATDVAGGNWTAKAIKAMTLSAVAGAIDLEAGAALTYEIGKTGSGVQLPQRVLVVRYRPRYPVVGRLVAVRNTKAYVQVGGFRAAFT